MTAKDLDLLRRFEPVVRYTQGELFFPSAVNAYLSRCSLWQRDEQGERQLLVPAGSLSLEKLSRFNELRRNNLLYLRFVQQPLRPMDFQQWRQRPRRPVFHATGRLSRVGLSARILNTFFDLSLVVRGTVPQGTTAAAEIQYQEMREEDPRHVYYGRVLREGGYTILHYLFFFPMNDWRSTFHGVNDHEADWEQVFIYLVEEDDDLKPRWVAFASHDFKGDDLRRRWDDPDITIYEENHPVIFAGAGSHASYFEPGEYLMGAEPEFSKPLRNFVISLRKFWAEQLGQGSAAEAEAHTRQLFSVPFIDYARGDGLSIGPGQQEQWSPVLISDEDAWVDKYRGLWGLDTRDPLGGERAPAGPKYNRDGSVRSAWYNPLGWAGLDKVPPPADAITEMRQRLITLKEEESKVAQEIKAQREALRLQALEVEALQQADYVRDLHKEEEEALRKQQKQLQALEARRVALSETCRASKDFLQRIEQGDWGDPQAHIRHLHHPEPPVSAQAGVVELWAALSGGLLLLALVAILIVLP
ncbi:MAG TPA: hypothetical protein EYH05_02260, partial [Anaerolineae bacterium]|nr:hypothetical protein [Anaerolineae bacterium]